jgi:outer membrane protein TolC
MARLWFLFEMAIGLTLPAMRMFFLTTFLVLTASVFAQPVLSLREALRIGLESNFDIRMAQNDVLMAKESNTPGMAGFLPNVGFAAGSNFQSSNLSQKFSSGLEVNRDGVGSNGINAGLALNWLFFDGGKMFITKKKLSRQLNASEIRLQNQIMAFGDSLSAAYYQVVLGQLDLNILKQTSASVEERLRISSEQNRIGTRPLSDVLQARIDLAQLKNRLLAQEKLIEIRKGAVNQMMGREPDQDFSPSDSVQLPEISLYADYKKKVLEKNLGLKQQRENLEVAKLGIGEIRSRIYPQIGLNMALNYQRTSSQAGFALFNRNSGPFAGISLSMPLYSGISVNRMLRIANKDLETKELQVKLSENRLLFQLWRAVKNQETFLESLDTEKSIQSLAQENLRIVQDRFRIGQANSLELKEAEVQLGNTLNRIEQLRFNARISANQIQRLAAELEIN